MIIHLKYNFGNVYLRDGKYGGSQGSNTLKLENTFHSMKTNFSLLKQIVLTQENTIQISKYNSDFKNTIQI